jgi:hypothetical protein
MMLLVVASHVWAGPEQLAEFLWESWWELLKFKFVAR